uniref:Uncharacterized protein n=1 Tax=Anguilla anguilla TaxID=7936 RepID=A0A0E9WRL7_ANGAN
MSPKLGWDKGWGNVWRHHSILPEIKKIIIIFDQKTGCYISKIVFFLFLYFNNKH